MPSYALSLHSLPTTPPQTDCYDKAFIVNDTKNFGELEDNDTTCSPLPQCSAVQPKASYYSLPPLLTIRGTSFKPSRLNSVTQPSPNSALVVGQVCGRGTDVNMSEPFPGSIAAAAAFHTPLASYAGESFDNCHTLLLLIRDQHKCAFGFGTVITALHLCTPRIPGPAVSPPLITRPISSLIPAPPIRFKPNLHGPSASLSRNCYRLPRSPIASPLSPCCTFTG